MVNKKDKDYGKSTGVMQIVSIHDLQLFLRLCGCEELKAPQSLLED